ncbi:MAG: OmpA family protein [Treponema sp.]|jgi:outer membrane protein OmpA-like peptidoglycan-associated protein|nr:OmpA family protein [Treponema sp.]
MIRKYDFYRVIRSILLVLVVFNITGLLYTQTNLPNTETPYISLDGGVGSSDVLVDGMSFCILLNPKLSLTPGFMIGSKNILHISTDDIIALEAQVFFRWNFLRLGSSITTDIFVQGGVGFLGAFKGSDVRDSRASLLADFTAGVTIPLASGWYIEPSIRGGYPFIAGAAITAGYKFPLTKKVEFHGLEYSEVIKNLPPNEIIRRIVINQVEYIIFAPDSARFNIGVDRDAQALNELVILHVAQILRENPDFRVRLEGHANPVTHATGEMEELVALSTARANEVARQLRQKGVRESQIVVIGYGGARILADTTDHDHWNMNRRVELIVIQVDTE